MTMTAEKKTGLEGVKPDKAKFPALKLMQGLSPEVQEGVEGAQIGTIFNTITGEFKKEVEIIAIGYQWKVVLYKTDDKGNPIEGAKGPERDCEITDEKSPLLEGRRFFNDKEDKTILKNAIRVHSWSVVVPGTTDVLKLEFKNTSQGVHDDLLTLLGKTGEHISKTVAKVSGTKSDKGAYQLFVVSPGRDATKEEAASALDLSNGTVPAEDGEVSF